MTEPYGDYSRFEITSDRDTNPALKYYKEQRAKQQKLREMIRKGKNVRVMAPNIMAPDALNASMSKRRRTASRNRPSVSRKRVSASRKRASASKNK
jgi:hypothetical protein